MKNESGFLKWMVDVMVILFSGLLLLACTSNPQKSATSEGDLPGIVFSKRSVDAIGDPLDPIEFSPGGDLMTLVPGAPSGKLRNLTRDLTNGEGDVSDPEIFPQTGSDSFRLVFSMKKSNTDNWHLYEMIINADGSRESAPEPLTCGPDNEVDPVYLPDGRIVFTSDRPGHLDEYERRKAALLHILDRTAGVLPAQPQCDSGEVVQISFNQSHDRNPTVLKDGTIMFSRWEHLARVNKFSIFKIEPDGTDLFIKYGSHSGVNSFLDVRERADGKLTASMMPLSGTFEGGAIGVLDVAAEADNSKTASQQLTGAQVIPTGREASSVGRYHGVYEVPDGSNRYLAAYSTGRVLSRMEEGSLPEEPSYGIWMLNNADGSIKPIQVPPAGSRQVFVEPIPLMAVPQTQIPTAKPAKVANRSDQGTTGVLAAASVYDSEANRALSDTVLFTDGKQIPRDGNGNIDFNILMADPNLQAVKEIRVIAAVRSMPGVGRGDIGSTRFERQKILGYAPVEADGSFRVTVPAETAITLNAVDSKRRSFKVKENWLQVRPGENKTCNGCHSPRRGDPQRLAADSIALNRAASALTPPAIPVIDFTIHVQTIFDAKCILCHSISNPAGTGPAGGLDLSGDQSGSGFPLSYAQLLSDMNGSNAAAPGESRQSHLIERVFGEGLRSGKPLPASDPNNHAALLSDAEKLTLVEWIDLGAQFTNNEVISQPARLNLDQAVFETSVLPVLTTRCGGCHVAGGASDFVLTGSAEGDFGAVAARTNVSTPADSILLNKAIGLSGGGVDMFDNGAVVSPSPLSTADADYTTILNWIAAAN
ncbi:MAG: hypothetical protein ACE5FY_01520 [Nitrospiria bacterium]